MRKPSVPRFACCIAVLTLAACATVPRDGLGPCPDPEVVPNPEKWRVESGEDRATWTSTGPVSCVVLSRRPIGDNRMLTTYLITVLAPATSETRRPYVVRYSGGAYDVITPLSSVEVGSSLNTSLVVRNSRIDDPGPNPPPPPTGR